jgi:hypothetical protein
MKYNITTNDGDFSSVTAFIGGDCLVATADHPNFDRIIEAVTSAYPNEDDVRGMFDMSVGIGARFLPLSERVSVHSGRIYLDHVEVDNALTKAIAAFYAEGQDNFSPLVAFMEKIEMNPNEHSREMLFTWLTKHKFSICPDGDFIAYKGISQDNKSSSSGRAIVNGVLHDGRIPNLAGTIIEMPRDEVQHDPKVGCHTGLHVGNWRYASNFASKTIRVKVNPRDVVSVPSDSNDEKMRVCRYKVMEQVAAEDTSMLFVDSALKTLCVRATEAGIAAKPTAAKPKAKIAKKAAKPKYYEDFKKADFLERPYKELQWLAGDWETKIARNASRDALASALTKQAATKRRERAKLLAAGKRAAKMTAARKG